MWIISVSWLLTFLFTVGSAEYLMATAFYEEKGGTVIALRASTWGLGQVMAVIMMAWFIWEIGRTFSPPCHRDGGRREFSTDESSGPEREPDRLDVGV